MKTKLERIADKSAHEPRPEFTSLYHLINRELLIQCHKELDGNKAVGIDEITKKEYGRNLEQNIESLVDRLKRKSYKPQPLLRVYIPCYVVDADIKGFFDHMKHEWIIRFLNLYIKDPNILWLVKKYLKAGVMDKEEFLTNEEGSA